MSDFEDFHGNNVVTESSVHLPIGKGTQVELIHQVKIKVSQWLESVDALRALRSTRNELKKLKEPFAVSKIKPKKAKEHHLDSRKKKNENDQY
jgi:hypothetical protein